MHFASHLLSGLALAVPGFFHLGRLQLPVFGMVAACGIVAALLLSRWTAQLAGMDPERLWDAGIVAVTAAFAASRLLLIAANAKLFLHRPLLVLAQPSLTAGGLLVAAFPVGFWLRKHRLPWRTVLDVWVAPGALLAAGLQLGHFLEGTDSGMPTTLPWGVHVAGHLTFARVHPVQLYAALTYVALDAWLLMRLRQLHYAGEHSGRMAASGLLAGGASIFLLGFLRQPYDTFGSAWLDPGQYAGLLAVLAGIGLWMSAPLAKQQLVAFPLTLAEEAR